MLFLIETRCVDRLISQHLLLVVVVVGVLGEVVVQVQRDRSKEQRSLA